MTEPKLTRAKAVQKSHYELTPEEIIALVKKILAPEKAFYWLAAIYGLGISLLTLAVPISVQMLINTVANTGLTTPLVILTITLFAVLVASNLLTALRIHLMEIFGRRFYARMVSEITLKTLYARNPFLMDQGKLPLFNRYFDIVIIQKAIPYLLIGGFATILQGVVGFVVVSLYHPLFFVFNIVVWGLLWLVWVIWGRRAMTTGVALSHAKHNAAAWLEALGASNGYFKSKRHIDYALDETDAYTGNYIQKHKKHFRQHFSQTVAFLFVYAIASAGLLGIGGWLVIQAQLSLGQLVAAELILSAVFSGVAQLGTYFNSFYDLCAASEELSLLDNIELEDPDRFKDFGEKDGAAGLEQSLSADLVFNNVRGTARTRKASFSFSIDRGSRLMASAENAGVKRLFTDLLKRHTAPEGGYLSLGGVDIASVDTRILRQHIIILDRPAFVDMSIRDYLDLASADKRSDRVFKVLDAVGLEDSIAELEEGLDTKLTQTGWPLSVSETLKLKLAASLLARPRVLILSELFDVLSEGCLLAAVDAISDDRDMTLIYFSNRARPLGFERFFWLGRSSQHFFDRFSDFQLHQESARPGTLAGESSSEEGPARLLPPLGSASSSDADDERNVDAGREG
ncbi:MAG: ABC transporter ATP-binding protein [Pseudomonadota bacterium]